MTPAVETLVLPLSGWVFQWRHDGRWRALEPDAFRDESADADVETDVDWIQWTGSTSCEARGGTVSDRPRWFFLYGELPVASASHVRLDDGTEPPVLTLGGMWICEWFSRIQDATVTVGEKTWVMPFKGLHDLGLARDS